MKIRHGDVIIQKIDKIPAEAKLLKGRKELAFGEVTGHAHRVDLGELFETKDGQLYLKIKKNEKLSTLTHEEHKSIQLDPGIYTVTPKRQYTPAGGWEKVVD